MRIVLLLDEGTSYRDIAGEAGSRTPSRPAPQKITPQLRAKVLDLGLACEIDDRLLAPLPFGFVAIEKVLFAAMRGVIGL